MYNQRVIGLAELPIPLPQRKYTDVICTWFHLLFVLGLLASTILLAKPSSNGEQKNPCPEKYQQLWSEAHAETIMCVEVCPSNYKRVGNVCYPVQEQQLQYYLQYSPFKVQWNQSKLEEIIVFIIIFVMSISLAILTLSYFASKIFQRFIIIVTLFILIYLALVLNNVLPTPSPLNSIISNIDLKQKQILTGIFGFIVLFLIAWLICFHKQLTWNGLMMDYASKILPEKLTFILFIFKYYVGIIIIFALFVFQSYAISHSSTIFFSWTVTPSFTPLQILNIFEFFWNLQYIKDTLYFSLANLTTSYYYSQQIDCCMNISLGCIHAGSTSGGSLVNTIFYVPNCILDSLCCFPQEKRQNCGLCCTSLTGIARQDAYAYQSLSGIPYCNSSRQCRKLGNQTNFWIGVNSPLSGFRLFLHVFTNIACITFGVVLMKSNHIQINVWLIFALFIVCQSLISGLIDVLNIHAESLQTSFLIDDSIEDQNEHIYDKSKIFQGELKEYLHNRQYVNPFPE